MTPPITTRLPNVSRFTKTMGIGIASTLIFFNLNKNLGAQEPIIQIKKERTQEDTLSPKITSVRPEPNAYNVDTDAAIEVIFNKKMMRTNGLRAKAIDGPEAKYPFDLNGIYGFSEKESKSVWTFDATPHLPKNSVISVEICGRDLDGNEISYAYQFSTGDPIYVSEEQENNKMLIFPNPANEIATLIIEMPEQNNARIRIFNALGRQIREIIEKRTHAKEVQIEIETQNLPNGVYFVQIEINEKIITHKLVVKR